MHTKRFKSSRGRASVGMSVNANRYKSQRTTLTLAPNARGGRLERNFDLTTPDPPCGLVTRLFIPHCDKYNKGSIGSITHPQMTRTLDPWISRLAL